MSLKVVIIGCVALGPKAACRLKRLVPQAEVTILDKDELISYGGCGIPFFVAGDVSDASELQSTSFHMLRDKKFFLDAKDVTVLTETLATEINREKKVVMARDLKTDRELELPYDKLVLATGSVPNRLPVPGSDLEGIFSVSNLRDAIRIKDLVGRGEVEKAVIVGAGFIGLEMAVALSDLWGIETTVVEIEDQLLPGVVGKHVARMVRYHMEENDVSFFFSEGVREFQGNNKVERVVTSKRTIEADLVITAVGIRPNSDLAKRAELAVSGRGGIIVNDRLETSDPDIFAGGDCIEVKHVITGRRCYMPLGSLANRQGRVIGTNLAGGNDLFEGVVGSFAVKLFDLSVIKAGLTLKEAIMEGFDAFNCLVSQLDRAHFYPEKDMMFLELTVDRKNGRILGIEGVCDNGDALMCRVNAAVPLLKNRAHISELSNLELSYTPPLAAAMDIINAAANTAENILAGRNRVIDIDDFEALWEKRSEGSMVVLDCRAWGNAAPFVEKYRDHWINIPQDELRKRIGEVPRDKTIVLVCNTGVRSYEAQLILDQFGVRNTFNLQGGVAALKKSGIHLV